MQRQDSISTARAAVDGARDYLREVKAACAAVMAPGGRVDTALAEAEQLRLHGFAWAASIVERLFQTLPQASTMAL